MINKLTLAVGFDQKESVAYHAFCQSVIEKASIPVQFLPLALPHLYFYKEHHKDGSNKFIYSRFLTPFLCDFTGFAVYADGDMVCHTDIAELKHLIDPSKAVQVVKHDYQTQRSVKYLNHKNVNYPRKNWSSLIVFNCEHPANQVLTPDFVQEKDGAYLHRFSWLSDDDIGELPKEWNWLAIEYPTNPEAKLIHYTLGTPCFKDFRHTDMADIWWKAHQAMNEGIDK